MRLVFYIKLLIIKYVTRCETSINNNSYAILCLHKGGRSKGANKFAGNGGGVQASARFGKALGFMGLDLRECYPGRDYPRFGIDEEGWNRWCRMA